VEAEVLVFEDYWREVISPSVAQLLESCYHRHTLTTPPPVLLQIQVLD
jgi:hypothetical protein